MTDFLKIDNPIIWPAIGLAIGFPVLLLILTEIINYCQRKSLPYERILRTLRTLVLPSLALLIFLRFILEIPESSTAVRIIESIFWLTLLYALLGVVNELIFGIAVSTSVRERVPKLFRDLVRSLLVGLGAMVIYYRVWGGDIGGALTALGLGSVVIGLALQEPLGNIVSGLMLLFERPLKVGDWVNAEGITGKVIEINWRSVHIETTTRELHVVPNVSLYKSTFSNLSRPTLVRTEVIEMGYSYDDPPNRVKEVMLDLLSSTEGVLKDPPPAVRTVNYADFSVIYRLIFSVASQEELGIVRDRIMTRIWYITRREGLNIPFPTALEYGPGESPSPPAPTAAELIQQHARFKSAVREDNDQPPRVIEYGKNEVIQKSGSAFNGFALIVKGHAAMLTPDAHGKPVEIGELGPGECFGDQLSTGASSADISIVAAEDLKILVFDNKEIDKLLNRSPALAAEIGDAIESRRQAALAARLKK